MLNIKVHSTYIHLYFIATQYLKVYPCERCKQLNSVLYPNNHILNSSKIIVNGSVLKEFSTCRQFESRTNKIVLLFQQNRLLH